MKIQVLHFSKKIYSSITLIKSLGATHLSIIGSFARHQQTLHSDLDIFCHWKTKQHWASNSNALAEYLSAHLKIKIDLTAPFHHKGCEYDIKKIPRIRIF